MNMMFSVLYWISYFLLAAHAYVLNEPRHTNTSVSLQSIYQFPNSGWVENIAIRKNGKLLVTLIDTPEVYEIDPTQSNPPRLVHRFPGVTSVLGITELEHDVFAVVTGNGSLATSIPTPGSFSVHKLILGDAPSSETRSSLITNLTTAQLPNGLIFLSHFSLLVSDSILGVVFQIDVPSGNYSVAIDLPSMKPPPGLSIGLNGIRLFNSYLYYTNFFANTFWRVSLILHSHTKVEVTGSAERLPHLGLGDDFAIDKHGNAYMVPSVGSAVEKVSHTGLSADVIVQDDLLSSATSAAFGRTPNDEDVLYVTTGQGHVVAVFNAKKAN